MTTTTYRLSANQAREYDPSTGWDFWETSNAKQNVTKEFETKDQALAEKENFIESLNISENEVYEIILEKILTETDEDGDEEKDFEIVESVDLIDKSESGFSYMLIQEYGQYQLPKGRYKIEYVTRTMQYATRNEFLLRIENGSFRWNVEEVFKTEEEVRQYIKDNPSIYIVDSVVSGVMEEEAQEEE